MEEQAKRLAELLRLLANQHRLLILCALTKEPLTVNRIAEHVPNISLPALSQHLQLLKVAGILDSFKNAQNVTYSIADMRVLKVMEVLEANYCTVSDQQVFGSNMAASQGVAVLSTDNR